LMQSSLKWRSGILADRAHYYIWRCYIMIWQPVGILNMTCARKQAHKVRDVTVAKVELGIERLLTRRKGHPEKLPNLAQK
jgi:hypothetical protein